MLVNNFEDFENIKKEHTRTGFGDGLAEAGKIDKNIMGLSADLTESTRLTKFKDHFPERFIECGVAEQNMIGVATGLALTDKIPFACSFACFSPARTFDQIRVSVCYSKANVKIVSSHSGIGVGKDGATHQSLEDIALMRVLPNMTVIVPSDYNEAKKATLASAKYNGPVYLRFTSYASPIFTTEDHPFEIGKAQVLLEGSDLTLVACGPLVYEALIAAKVLKDEGISVEVINSPTVKPLDTETILNSVRKTNKLVTLEDHQIAGGLGSTVTETLAQIYPVKTLFLGMNDSFGESGDTRELFEKYGLDFKGIVSKIKNFQ